MSARKRAVDLTEDAQRDYREILVYGEHQWGTRLRDRYESKLERGLQTLARHPFIGRARDEIAPGVRSFVVQQHVVLYRVEEDTIRVLRLVHGRMDLDTLSFNE